ncbi:DotU family type IV/VI secretion system protein [uncultured Desulfobulbus sp.]|uniref:DotU family type IV/VI secretion system protein n=1 Tax=uncultured Desulfobulbus sp. TaxID=239745 RepID=UPI0029C77226|nr:DotU family type IV/VI secretion system protein [uncultured Desulfobulbus sp.]
MRLIDCFLKPLAYTAHMVGTGSDASVALPQANKIIHRLLDESGKRADHAGFAPQEYNEARFAVCAWIDEAILNSNLPESDLWLGELLQRAFYSTNRAGEEFYTRMDNLSESELQVREVFHHCLALGFKGRYFSPEMASELETIKQREFSRLKREHTLLTPGNQEQFFPASYPKKSAPRRRALPRVAFSFVTLFMILAPLVFLTLTYYSYSTLLDGMVEKMIHLESK